MLVLVRQLNTTVRGAVKLSATVLGLMLLAVGPAAHAQETPAQSVPTWTGRVGVGQFVRVETAAGSERSGRLVQIDPDSLYLHSGSVAKNQIIRLRVFEGTRARRYGMVGAVGGALFLGYAGYELNGLDDSATPCRGLHCGALPGAVVGAVVGYGVGALLGSTMSVWRTIKDTR